MKIITLNTWGGRIHKPLLSFVEKNKAIDIFCFQEIYSDAEGKKKNYNQNALNLYEDLRDILPDHQGFFRPSIADFYGLAMFVDKNLKINKDGELFVYQEKGFIPKDNSGMHARNIQYIKIELDNKFFAVINFHGLWTGTGAGKKDTPDRIEQSKKIVNFTKSLAHEFVLCGDFNLLPETESIKIIEDSGLRNLIKEHGIQSTRSSYYTKSEKYADYVFVTPHIQIKQFKVLPDEVSDHLALYLEI